MSQFNRKGYSTVRAQDAKGSIQHIAVHKNGKLARIAKHKRRQMGKLHQQRLRDYKQKLRDAKKRYPIEQRSKLRLDEI